MNKELIERNFTYHTPRPNDIPKMASVRSQCRMLALLIDSYMPDSREKSLALTALEEVSMWTNAGIVRNEEQIVMLGGPEGSMRQIMPSTMSPDSGINDKARAAIEGIQAIVATHGSLATPPKAGKCGRDGGCGSCGCNG